MKTIKKYAYEIGGIVFSLIGYAVATNVPNTPDWVEVPFAIGFMIIVVFLARRLIN